MTRSDALPIARRIAAAVREAEGADEHYCRYMREGAYDDCSEVQIAVAALVVGAKSSRESNVVELAA